MAKVRLLIIVLLILLISCSVNEEEQAIETSAEPFVSEQVSNGATNLAERYQAVDLACIADMENPRYEQLREEVIKLIPFDEWELRLLAWDSMADNRPKYYDSALFWIKEERENPKWLLINMTREPRPQTSRHFQWHLEEATDGAWTGYREFATVPLPEDVYDFTVYSERDSSGHPPRFMAHSGFELIDARVCEQTWRETVGGEPPHYLSVTHE